MKTVNYLFVATLILVSTSVRGQSIYNFQYSFINQNTSTAYHAFMLRNVDGSGLIRIRFQSSENAFDVLIEADVNEQYPTDVNGMQDTNTLLISAINPRFIMGDNKSNYTTPFFIFKYNPGNDFFEPSGITDANENNLSANTFTWQLMEGAAMNKEFISQYFSEDEDFYSSFFKPVTRSLSPVEKNVKFYLLVVADTLDKEIGASCNKDMQRALQTFRDLTDYLGIKFLPITVCGNTYSKENVQAALNSLKPGPDDIVVFYYSGHGFRIPEKPREFPNIKLKNFRNLRENFRDSTAWIKKDRLDNITYSMNMEDIFNSIRKKGARFNLVISDCCDDDIFSVNATGTKPGQTKGSGVQWSEDNIRMLFLDKNPMSVLATAAKQGQRASSNNNFGGFFSYFFKISLENYCSKIKNGPTWDQIMQDASAQTINKANHTYCDKPYIPANICKQEPIYKIIFGR
ncbi:MAG: caspase family protein [Bacteroidetes bacterium]|nr:caspase family protein [Bacteroidota bacterium]MBS1930618.1 caspase family protein [Bacteroidota bacterium]